MAGQRGAGRPRGPTPIGLLAGSSVLLAPAPLEPFGLSVVEAMAHGLPVVAAGGGAHLETVGEDGLLFPPGDAPAAAAALARLGGDPALRRSVGDALRHRQQDRFTLTGHVDRLERLYREVADGVRRPGRTVLDRTRTLAVDAVVAGRSATARYRAIWVSATLSHE